MDVFSSAKSLYQFQDFESVSGTDKSIGARLLTGELDGVIINNFISPVETASILKGFRALGEKDLIRINEGFSSYPISFAQYTQQLLGKTTTEENFHDYALRFRKGFASAFGVDIENKLVTLFEGVFRDAKVEVPVDRNQFGSFIPFNFRELFPRFGELKLHCENLFFNEFPLFFQLMSHSVLRKNDFSFFIVLQKPEEGGELSLFDAKWDDGDNESFSEIEDTNNFVAAVANKNLRKQMIAPDAGSIVLFSGGDIWHKVEIVQGTRSRITLGGFLSSGVDPRKMFMWA